MVNPVQQSGNPTAGHIATWITTGVIGDGGLLQQGNTILARLLSADFNSILDQPLQLPKTITAFSISGILITNASLSMTTAAGGFYPTTAKGGTAIVAAGQVYSSLTTAAKLLSATLVAATLTTRYSSANVDVISGYPTIYLSLTTGQGVSATGDCYLLGTNLSV